MRLDDKSYQPGPKLKESSSNCEFTDVLKDVALSLSRGGGGNHQQEFFLIKFERNGKNGKYRANIFCDNKPLKPKDSLGTAIKLAVSKEQKIFVKKKDHEIVIELCGQGDGKEGNVITVFDESDYTTCIGSIIATPGIDSVFISRVTQKQVLEITDDEYDVVVFA